MGKNFPQFGQLGKKPLFEPYQISAQDSPEGVQDGNTASLPVDEYGAADPYGRSQNVINQRYDLAESLRKRALSDVRSIPEGLSHVLMAFMVNKERRKADEESKAAAQQSSAYYRQQSAEEREDRRQRSELAKALFDLNKQNMQWDHAYKMKYPAGWNRWRRYDDDELE